MEFNGIQSVFQKFNQVLLKSIELLLCFFFLFFFFFSSAVGKCNRRKERMKNTPSDGSIKRLFEGVGTDSRAISVQVKWRITSSASM